MSERVAEDATKYVDEASGREWDFDSEWEVIGYGTVAEMMAGLDYLQRYDPLLTLRGVTECLYSDLANDVHVGPDAAKYIAALYYVGPMLVSLARYAVRLDPDLAALDATDYRWSAPTPSSGEETDDE